jgi:glyoxylase I family protein
MIRGIHHVGINCRDMDRMVRFYRDAFGFEPLNEGFDWGDSEVMDELVDVPGSKARGIMMRAGTCYIELFQYSAPAAANEAALRPNDHGYTHFCVDVVDIDSEFERFKTAGMDFGGRELKDMGHVKTLYGRDPEGNVIEIQQCAPNNGFTLEELRATA